jgi:hypothetical protein
LDNIDYDKINKWLKRKGYLEDDTDDLLFWWLIYPKSKK